MARFRNRFRGSYRRFRGSFRRFRPGRIFRFRGGRKILGIPMIAILAVLAAYIFITPFKNMVNGLFKKKS